MAGATATMTSGNAIAAAKMRTASLRAGLISGEDNNMTGSSVQADIDQSEVSRTPIAGAIKAGSSNGAQNDTAARRRLGSGGQPMSLRVFPSGRIKKITMRRGTEIYARLPNR